MKKQLIALGAFLTLALSAAPSFAACPCQLQGCPCQTLHKCCPAAPVFNSYCCPTMPRPCCPAAPIINPCCPAPCVQSMPCPACPIQTPCCEKANTCEDCCD